MDGAKNGGFEAGEREIETVNLWMRKAVFMRVAIERALGDVGAAGVGEADDFGDFVEAFADGIVAGGTNNLEMIMLGHIDDLSVAAGYDKRKEGKRRGCRVGMRLAIVKPVGVDVGFEMVDGVKRLVPENREHAGGESANEKGT